MLAGSGFVDPIIVEELRRCRPARTRPQKSSRQPD